MLLSLPFTLASTAAFSPSRVLVAHSLPIHPRVGPVKMQRLTNLEECVLSVPLGDVPECMRLMDEAMEKKPDPPALSRDGRHTLLAECLSAAKTNEEQDECVLVSDDGDEHSYG